MKDYPKNCKKCIHRRNYYCLAYQNSIFLLETKICEMNEVSKDYSIVFIKDNIYRGGMAFTSFTTRDTIESIKHQYSELFNGDFYDTYEYDYQAIEIIVNEENYRLCDKLEYSYEGDTWAWFFREIKEALDIAIKNNFKMFLI